MERLDAGAPVNLSPYPPVNAMDALHARERRMREERLERRMQARAEMLTAIRFYGVTVIAAVLVLIVTVVHP